MLTSLPRRSQHWDSDWEGREPARRARPALLPHSLPRDASWAQLILHELKFLVTSFWFHSLLGLTALLPPFIHSHLTL